MPIDDATAWNLYPEHRWIYNKLAICETQGLPHGPHGTEPDRYPIFSKPIYNMRGMGTGGRIVRNAQDYWASLEPGHLWMPLFVGRHVSTDVAIENGRPRWWRHTTGKPGPKGTFDYWTVHAGHEPDLERYLGRWVRRHLKGFDGVINFETIGGQIVECHLRMAEQWLDINGPGWLTSVVRLYSEGVWQFRDRRRQGYSVVLFDEHGVDWDIDRKSVARFLQVPGISSIQITFDPDIPLEHHAMPPGGFRLAIINCWDLQAGRKVRSKLKQAFRHGRAQS
ncbi:MAG TPA: hypothetical protein VEU47_09235 [Candidatus Cybelea sp.]|nr:hypothetical protein [Candidatus Cybelea sp.]